MSLADGAYPKWDMAPPQEFCFGCGVAFIHGGDRGGFYEIYNTRHRQDRWDFLLSRCHYLCVLAPNWDDSSGQGRYDPYNDPSPECFLPEFAGAWTHIQYDDWYHDPRTVPWWNHDRGRSHSGSGHSIQRRRRYILWLCFRRYRHGNPESRC